VNKTIKKAIKYGISSALYRVSPDAFDQFREAVTRRSMRQWPGQESLDVIDACVAQYGLEVHEGPFAGMKYVRTATGSSFLAKLIGSYECELHPLLRELLATPYESVVDVGCAEGYYAVGFARCGKAKRVYAFDTDAEARLLCRRLASLNGMDDRVVVRGECNPETMEAVLKQGRSLVICDCEGYEMVLLDPERAPSLRNADVLVELHDCFNPEISPVMLPRFEATHDLLLIHTTPRRPEEYGLPESLTDEQRRGVLEEGRPPEGMQWAFLRARIPAAVPASVS